MEETRRIFADIQAGDAAAVFYRAEGGFDEAEVCAGAAGWRFCGDTWQADPADRDGRDDGTVHSDVPSGGAGKTIRKEIRQWRKKEN